MTVLVGVCCSDGVVVGADSIATSAMGPSGLVQLQTDKISIVGDRIIVAGTGSVGLKQRFVDTVSTIWSTKGFQARGIDCARKITMQAIADFQSTGVQFSPQRGWGFGAMLAAPLDDRAQLVEFGIADMQPEFREGKLSFLTMGSGQMLADPFMAFASRVLWGDGIPDVALAKFGVYWSLSHTIKYAPGGVGLPIRIAVLKREKGQWKASLMGDEELQETAMHIQQIEARISEYPRLIVAEAEEQQVPRPPT